MQTGGSYTHFGEGAMVPYNPYLAIKNVDETVSTWVPSINDCLADDRQVIGRMAEGLPPAARALDEKQETTFASPSWTSSLIAMPCSAS